MITRLLPWQLLALASLGIAITGTVAWIQTGDFLLQLFFAGIGMFVAAVAYLKYRWIEHGKYLWKPISMHVVFGRSKNCTHPEYLEMLADK